MPGSGTGNKCLTEHLDDPSEVSRLLMVVGLDDASEAFGLLNLLIPGLCWRSMHHSSGSYSTRPR